MAGRIGCAVTDRRRPCREGTSACKAKDLAKCSYATIIGSGRCSPGNNCRASPGIHILCNIADCCDCREIIVCNDYIKNTRRCVGAIGCGPCDHIRAGKKISASQTSRTTCDSSSHCYGIS